MAKCHVCEHPLESLLDFGPQAFSHRLHRCPVPSEDRVDLQLALCDACGLVQLPCAVPIEKLKPDHPIRYREPERHLDAWVEQFLQRVRPAEGASLLGISYKDESTVDRFHRRVGIETRTLDAARDWGILDPNAGLETLTDVIAHSRGGANLAPADIVIARHVLEHAAHPREFLRRIAALVVDSGWLLLEVPDCQTAMEQLDYTMTWDEHVSYFTSATLHRLLVAEGFSRIEMVTFPDFREGSLTACAQVPAGGLRPQNGAVVDIQRERAMAKRYACEFENTRNAWRRRLSTARQAYGEVALLGAGHVAIAFLNLLELHDLITLVIDDAPDKGGRFLPGSQLPIVTSDCLNDGRIGLCLMTVAAETEPLVLHRQRAFVERGGQLLSIFPNSHYAAQRILG